MKIVSSRRRNREKERKRLMIGFDDFVLKAAARQRINRNHGAKRRRDAITTTSERKRQRKRTNWRNALYGYIRGSDDDRAVISRSKMGVLIHDKYPKATVHLLLLPTEEMNLFKKITIEKLEKSDLKEIEAFHHMAREFVRSRYSKDMKFRIGYHAIPSMKPLHLHIISCDFESDRLKNKKHWNSFTTSFFVDADIIETSLKHVGHVSVNRYNMNALLKSPLECHRCGKSFQTIPSLKRHISTSQTCRRTEGFQHFKAFVV